MNDEGGAKSRSRSGAVYESVRPVGAVYTRQKWGGEAKVCRYTQLSLGSTSREGYAMLHYGMVDRITLL
jgi:hypothetical protein